MSAPAAEPEKKTYYVGKADGKYQIMKQSIGTDYMTVQQVVQEIPSSTSISTSKVGAIDVYDNTAITFNYSKSGNELVDWDNSYIAAKLQYMKTDGTATVSAEILIPWNDFFNKFSEVSLKIGGVVVFTKVGGDYQIAQTLRNVIMIDKSEADAAQCFMQPIGGKTYCRNIADAASVADGADLAELSRNSNWWTLPTVPQQRMCSLKHAFFSIPGLCANMRDIEMTFKVKPKADQNIGHHAAGTEASFITDMKLIMRTYRPSDTKIGTTINDKLAGVNDNISFIDITLSKTTYSDCIQVHNATNAQFFGLIQFANKATDATKHIRNMAPDQTYLFNARASDATIGNALERSDETATGGECLSSVQLAYKGGVYPYNAISTAKGDTSLILDTSRLYAEYAKVCNDYGNIPVIDEQTFKTTFPFIVFKPYAGSVKLTGTSDWQLLLRATGNPAGQNCHPFYGELKSFQIQPSGQVVEINNNSL